MSAPPRETSSSVPREAVTGSTTPSLLWEKRQLKGGWVLRVTVGSAYRDRFELVANSRGLSTGRALKNALDEWLERNGA